MDRRAFFLAIPAVGAALAMRKPEITGFCSAHVVRMPDTIDQEAIAREIVVVLRNNVHGCRAALRNAAEAYGLGAHVGAR